MGLKTGVRLKGGAIIPRPQRTTPFGQKTKGKPFEGLVGKYDTIVLYLIPLITFIFISTLVGSKNKPFRHNNKLKCLIPLIPISN